jgi:UDP-N-acetylglucosamine 2-epimerase (non-hydrolysing)
MKILNVVGARPNFMKVAPLHEAFTKRTKIESKVLHTGQHYDAKMSDIFFNQLGMPEPHFYLGIGGGSHTQTTAKIMLEFEKVMLEEQPDLVLVVGDVNSTIACALVASKLNTKVAHVEAGLRSGDHRMPEEINRILTDRISDLMFVTEQSGMIHLAKEGVADEKIHFVGNVMIDSLVRFREKARQSTILSDLGVAPKDYVLMTMHRPANVDNEKSLRDILTIIENTADEKEVIFPIHPRTEKNMAKFGLDSRLRSIPNLTLLGPQGYFEFLHLMDHAFLVITDSGGIQEETTFLQVPCFTFRDSTERPITVTLGTNQLLADLNPATVQEKYQELLAGKTKQGIIPPLWDGNTAERIADILETQFTEASQSIPA